MRIASLPLLPLHPIVPPLPARLGLLRGSLWANTPLFLACSAVFPSPTPGLGLGCRRGTCLGCSLFWPPARIPLRSLPGLIGLFSPLSWLFFSPWPRVRGVPSYRLSPVTHGISAPLILASGCGLLPVFYPRLLFRVTTRLPFLSLLWCPTRPLRNGIFGYALCALFSTISTSLVVSRRAVFSRRSVVPALPRQPR